MNILNNKHRARAYEKIKQKKGKAIVTIQFH